MNIFFNSSQTSLSETIIFRLVALLAVVLLSTLPAVAGANTVTDADLFSGAEVEPLSTVQMSETHGQFPLFFGFPNLPKCLFGGCYLLHPYPFPEPGDDLENPPPPGHEYP